MKRPRSSARCVSSRLYLSCRVTLKRFLPERSVGRPKFAYFPFSGGQRKCIGDQFTMLELTTVLATVLRAYRFELKEGHEAVPSPNVTLPMRDPLPMRLIPR